MEKTKTFLVRVVRVPRVKVVENIENGRKSKTVWFVNASATTLLLNAGNYVRVPSWRVPRNYPWLSLGGFLPPSIEIIVLFWRRENNHIDTWTQYIKSIQIIKNFHRAATQKQNNV